MGNYREGQAKVRNGERALLGTYCRDGNSKSDIGFKEILFLKYSCIVYFLNVIKFLLVIFHHLKIISSKRQPAFFM